MYTNPPFYIKLSHSLISISLILLLLYLGQNIFIPLAFACLFCILLIAPCRSMEKYGIPRGIAALISVILAITAVFIVFYFISSQIISFKNDLPHVGAQLFAAITDLELWVQKKFNVSAESMKDFLNSATSQTLSHTTSLVGTTFSTLSSTLIYVVLVPIYTFLLLLYRNLVVQFFVKSFNEEHTSRVFAILTKARLVIKSYIVGLSIEMIIVALMNYTGFLILGIQYALLLAVISAVLNLIPYLGIFTAALLSMMITFTTDTPATVIGVGVVLIIVHLIDSNILLPKIVGSKVKINALVTILGVVLGSSIWGIPGMFLAVPIIAILKVIFDGIDHLEPWGYILGDEVTVEKISKKNFFKIKKIMLQKKISEKKHQEDNHE